MLYDSYMEVYKCTVKDGLLLFLWERFVDFYVVFMFIIKKDAGR